MAFGFRKARSQGLANYQKLTSYRLILYNNRGSKPFIMSIETRPITNDPWLSAEQQTTVKAAGDVIIKKGDALDKLSNFRRIRTLGPTASVSAFVYATYGIHFSHTLESLPTVFGLGVATTASLIAARPIARRIENKNARRSLKQNEILSDIAGTKVELYRYKTGKGPRKKNT